MEEAGDYSNSSNESGDYPNFSGAEEAEYDSHFSAYGTCLGYIRSQSSANCTFSPHIPLPAFHSFILIGASNNTMSMIVFLQPKYGKRLLSVLLRYYYVCNIIVVFFIFVDEFFLGGNQVDSNHEARYETLHRICRFPYNTAFKTSIGILSYISILRFVNSVRPWFIASSKHAQTLSYLALMGIITVSVGLHVKSLLLSHSTLMDVGDLWPNVIFYMATIIIIIFANTSWVSMEKMRAMLASTGGGYSSRHTNKIFQFAFISSVLYVLTTLPGTVFLISPPRRGWRADCESCLDKFQTGHLLNFIMMCSCFFDNAIYCFQSKVYRSDLKWGVKRLLTFKSIRKQRPISLMRRSMFPR